MRIQDILPGKRRCRMRYSYQCDSSQENFDSYYLYNEFSDKELLIIDGLTLRHMKHGDREWLLHEIQSAYNNSIGRRLVVT